MNILGSLLISRYAIAKYLLVKIGDGVEEGIGRHILKDDSQGIFCLLINKLAINGTFYKITNLGKTKPFSRLFRSIRCRRYP